ncbi:MAG: sigma-54-dependent Fis family transcriptional regulator [Methylococcaceae bacterium]
MTQHSDQTIKSDILIVDDTIANLKLLSDLLARHHHKVRSVTSGAMALTAIEASSPDLILLDIRMPEMDGFEVCAKLKSAQKTRNIPIIFISALDDVTDKVKAFEAGAVDYVTKPFQHAEVIARVHTHLLLQSVKKQLQKSQQQLSQVIHSAMDAIISIDQTGNIVLFNNAAENIFGCSAVKVTGQPLSHFMSETLTKVIAEFIEKSAEQPVLWIPEGHHAIRVNGSVFPIEATLSYCFDGEQKLYTLILRDIETQKKTESERNHLRGINLYLQDELRSTRQSAQFVYQSKQMQEVMSLVDQVAATDATVMITGETGTGKELISRAVHNASPRKDRELIRLNCASIPENLVESELFGHEKGAFTGAIARKTGRFELADGSSLFLDEIGEMSLDMQTKLLRVLQEGEIERVGGTTTIKVNVRIITATHRDLAACVRAGTFREDLFYRLNVFPISLPPLRERKEDLSNLIQHFVGRFADKFGKKITTVPSVVVDTLQNYHWPGNIRELQHLIERAVILSQGPELNFGDWLQPGIGTIQNQDLAPPLTLEENERSHILKALENVNWQVSGKNGAAEMLDIKPTTLQSRMIKLGINRGKHNE